MNITEKLAAEFQLRQEQIENTIALLDDGKTIPFIARYRKERTGSLDDQVLRAIDTRLQYLRKLEQRKMEICTAIAAQEKLTPELEQKIQNAETLVEAEDLYLPYRPKRKTRASAAIARGLEPLARILMEQNPGTVPEKEAAAFVQPEGEVPDTAAALQGAKDILAEEMANDADLRKQMRRLVMMVGVVESHAGTEAEDTPYQNYADYQEPVKRIAGHRVLAIDRGEREGVLKVSITLPEGHGPSLLLQRFVKNQSPSGKLVQEAAEDAFQRLLYPAVEREIRRALTEQAASAAIKVFASNLRQLLMAAPLKNRVVLGVDPGYRTGCKLAVVDATGKVLDTGVAYITIGEGRKMEQGKETIRGMMLRHGVTAVAIGNGTASREAESVVASLLKELPGQAAYMVVSEAGASVYSASKLAAEEFPEYDVSLRSAVSIARRLQDPLAELVKIDPQAIGVGQYQHDMPKAELTAALDGVVEDCVNRVGVDLNTASFSLLSHIAGINQTIAKNIVAYRTENGAFTDRKQLKKVAKLGPKAFEQCAGFLRVPGGKNPLDNTAVHPESYAAAEQILHECGFGLTDLSGAKQQEITALVQKQGVSAVAEKVGVGVPTVQDIVKELAKPGRDPRDELPPPLLRSGDVMELKDLKPGMELVGTVRNVIDFGCFVDVGVHEDGLVHISQICDRFIRHPLEAVKVGDVVKVWVLDVDLKRKRISLTMKKPKQ
ncbi:Tex family protein [uncultured Ruminococcus sp.]|uniref:Tex family protein n=1 Tax=uncultured Ruminococcus sp. TaxID=165186 RepID=UPI0025FB8C74|nr:Tex family protein [uncultured Ruminococcus sp.]